MTWTHKVDYCITNGQHHIAKLYVNGEAGYLLWLDGKLVHRNFTSSKEAMEYADECVLQRERSTGGGMVEGTDKARTDSKRGS